MQGYAQALESAIHDESDIEVHLTVVDEALTRLIGELQSVFPEEAVEEEEVVESTITSEAAGELVVELEGQHAVWEKLSETLSMNDIEDFANQIKNLGDQYDYAPLTLWAEKLAEQASLFDLDNMAKTLEHYPECIQNLKRIVNL